MQLLYLLSPVDAIAKLGLGDEVTEDSRKALEQPIFPPHLTGLVVQLLICAGDLSPEHCGCHCKAGFGR